MEVVVVDKVFDDKGGAKEECRFDQWVDYLPHHHHHHLDNDEEDNPKGGADRVKRVSLDVTESHLTESQDDDDDDDLMDTWPDSASLEDYAMVPNVLLVENDPFLQHELLLTDPTMNEMAISKQFTSSLQDVLEDRRRVLMASMEASQRTRRCLEPHIKQRASLASVLSDIEGSSKSLREMLHPPAAPPMVVASMEHHDVHMEEEEQEMLASALDLEDEEPPLAV